MDVNIHVKDKLLTDLGAIHVREFLERQLQLYELQLLANRVTKQLQKSKDVDWKSEFDKAQKEAWDEYSQKFFNKE